jgi:hypothetical protein
MTVEELKELIYNSELDYSSLNIKNDRALGHITVLVSETEFEELETTPYFYLDEFEININKYYTEALKLTLLNEDVKEIFPDVEFQFSTSRKEVG